VKTNENSSTCGLALLSAALCGLSLAGCGQGGEPVATANQTLYGTSDLASHWPDGVVNVCYDPGNGDNPLLLSRAQQILIDSWGAVANISFVGWKSCPPPFPFPPLFQHQSWVRVHFSSGTNGETSHIGRWDGGVVEVNLISDGTSQHFQYEVIHEFGHALGFYHEQERPDNWPNGTGDVFAAYCDSLDNGREAIYGGVYLTACYDKQSIMNYCAGQPTQLSGGDIDGARAAYGFSPMCTLITGCEPTNPDQGTRSVADTTSVWGRTIKLYVTSVSTAWAGIENGQPGDEVWLDRSFGGGCTWDPKLGDTFIPDGWTLWRTLGYLQNEPAPALVRACGKAGNRPEIACTGWH
jgi:hypothetical protein